MENAQQLDRLATLSHRLAHGFGPTGDPEDVIRAAMEVCGALTASRVALRQSKIRSSVGRDEAAAATKAIIAAEDAVLRYRDSLCADLGVKPWEISR